MIAERASDMIREDRRARVAGSVTAQAGKAVSMTAA
jgi:choline dehydrogenase